MEQLGISAIHPSAPEVLSVVALFNAPIDLAAAIVRLREIWSIKADGSWQHVVADPNEPNVVSGDLYQFQEQGVTALLSPISGALQVPGGGKLPDHVFHLPITLYAPADAAQAGVLAGEDADNDGISQQIPEVKRRKRMVSAHILLTEILDALMRESAAVGVFRSELGVVQPPQMITELAESLTQGRVPLPLWVNIRTQNAGLSFGRTLGLPLFGHLDLEVRESLRNPDEIYLLLADIANYLITSNTYLLPGQTLGSSQGEKLAITQELSPFDQNAVIRVMY
ncbi:DUF4261 domain-containing protein [Arcanobacterium hippocoleae]|uniref:DUF4261 domain-containing protein n=1 Tax=Arcanobacterium hippocoleae TaxID=149017 RepID=A0ABU1T2K9_9ACTO|nr:DUF4261 domain-containing protein [Arcanobacterium hippocoleae]MDR6939608.1 hypothetical protein [Arcanobacterium hippocoleae]